MVDLNNLEDAPDGEFQVPEMTIDEAMKVAVTMHQQGALSDAQAVYTRIIAAAPGFHAARHFLGLVTYQLGRKEDGVRLIAESIKAAPEIADWHSNLGNILMEEFKLDDAAEELEKAVAISPEHTNALSNLGRVYGALKRYPEAEACYRRALAADPEHYAATQNLGALLSKLHRHEEAVGWLTKAVINAPKNHQYPQMLLARSYSATGQPDKAAEIYRQVLAAEPRHASAKHMLAAVTDTGVPERASDDYVTSEFDHFASAFDKQLAALEYRAPQFMAEALDAANAGRKLDIIDAGCGTGLCGPLIKHHANSLVGVDLSGNMLKLAEPRGYNELHKAELTGFLAARKAACDCIISADTLCYFGALEDFSEAAFGALRPGGILIFSVEAITGEGGGGGYAIQQHGRYMHRRGYLESVLAGAGFNIEAVRESVLRQEIAKPVHGFVVTARKP